MFDDPVPSRYLTKNVWYVKPHSVNRLQPYLVGPVRLCGLISFLLLFAGIYPQRIISNS